MSLLFCVTGVVVWIRSYGLCEGVEYAWALPAGIGVIRNVVYSNEGRVVFYRNRQNGRSQSPLPGRDLGWAVSSDPRGTGLVDGVADEEYQRFGVGYVYWEGLRGSRSEKSVDLVVPDWSIALGFAVVPVQWAVLRWRRPRLRGLCANCGYDLRATPQRCPECGHIPPRS
jgi:hypothetical protein